MVSNKSSQNRVSRGIWKESFLLSQKVFPLVALLMIMNQFPSWANVFISEKDIASYIDTHFNLFSLLVPGTFFVLWCIFSIVCWFRAFLRIHAFMHSQSLSISEIYDTLKEKIISLLGSNLILLGGILVIMLPLYLIGGAALSAFGFALLKSFHLSQRMTVFGLTAIFMAFYLIPVLIGALYTQFSSNFILFRNKKAFDSIKQSILLVRRNLKNNSLGLILITMAPFITEWVLHLCFYQLEIIFHSTFILFLFKVCHCGIQILTSIYFQCLNLTVFYRLLKMEESKNPLPSELDKNESLIASNESVGYHF